MFNFWWLAGLVDGLEPNPLPFSSQKNEMLIFVLHSTSDDWLGWSLDSNPIHLHSQAKKNEMLIFGLRLTSDDQPGWLMNLNPICHPCPAKKMKCSFLDYVQLLMIGQAGQWTPTPSATPLQPKKWYAHFWNTLNFLWLARLVNGLKPHLQALSNQKNEMLIFGLCSTSDDQPGWSKDSNPICNLFPTKKMKWSFFWIMFNFRWSARLVEGLQPHLPPLSNQKNEMLVFVLCYSSDHQPGWSMDSKPIHHPSSQKNEMLIFVLRSTSDDLRGWLMDSNPIHYPSPAKKLKCSFLHYIQLLMIGRAARWTQTPSVTPLQPKKWNACFCIMFNFWWSAGLVDGLEPHLPPLWSQKNEMLIFVLHSTSDDWPGWS